MAEISFIKTKSGLSPHTEHDDDSFKRWKLGTVITGKFTQVRNVKFHKKFFALLNLTFDYYEPSGGVLTPDEKRIAKIIFMNLDKYNDKNGFFIEYGRDFLKKESEERRKNIETIEKSFEPFRKWLTVEAGFYNEVPLPSGVVKEAKSISFAKMDDMEFDDLYKSIFNVCWRFVLSRVFNSEHEAEEAATRLINFN